MVGSDRQRTLRGYRRTRTRLKVASGRAKGIDRRRDRDGKFHEAELSFDFQAVCKLIVLANDAPHLNRVDHAFRRRLLLMPFTRKPANEDKQLGAKLQAEAGRILSWMAEGASAYLKHGLGHDTSGGGLGK